MKLVYALMLAVAVVAAAPPDNKIHPANLNDESAVNFETRNFVVNALVNRLIAYVRYIINNGSHIFGIPPLDPLSLDEFHLVVPAGLINLDLELKDIFATGFGGFVTHRSNLNLRELTFDLDVSVPFIDISTQYYDLLGDLFTAIPLYGKGNAGFKLENFRFQAKLWLKQSDNEKSVIIDNITNVGFQIPGFKSEITGAIDGGDIDAIVNAMAEEVFMGYVNRFQGAIGLAASKAAKAGLNPILGQLDTWRYIAPLLPRGQ